MFMVVTVTVDANEGVGGDSVVDGGSIGVGYAVV